ncbi:hypothetical protein B0H65DRAFT_219803 [Neurospora tetraspora]|uniref:Uncharacterized protein n=1 Tax=Neurospora tetraspora TaxID=94610 RepID=A0AAE0MQ64_9PEZI|nr:hypothetical protein B0H65DRAFT_219803 [Neurospora tetraspora]
MPFLGGLPTSHLPLLLHLIIETPASLSFLLRPESQLPLLSSHSSSSIPSSSITSASSKSTKQTTKITPKEAVEARLILSNFGGLLLTVNCLIIHLLLRYRGPGPGNEELIRGVTGCLSLYHVFPQYRALRRIGMGLDIYMPYMGFPAPAGDEKKGLKEDREEDETQKTLGGPVVHFIVHMIVGGLMSAVGFGLL